MVGPYLLFRAPQLIRMVLGHLARIGPSDLMTDDADTLRYISDPKKSGFVRSDWYTANTLGRLGFMLLQARSSAKCIRP